MYVCPKVLVCLYGLFKRPLHVLTFPLHTVTYTHEKNNIISHLVIKTKIVEKHAMGDNSGKGEKEYLYVCNVIHRVHRTEID